MARTCYRKEIEVAALKYDLSPALVEAMVLVESAGYTDAFRYEAGFWSRYMATNHTWKFARDNPRRYSASYGLMQVMYPVATEMGFSGEPEMLFVPEVGLDWGCKKLASLMDWANSERYTATSNIRVRSALAAYNGGKLRNEPDETEDRNSSYASKVLQLVRAT